MVPLDGDHGDPSPFQFREHLLRLSQVRRLDLCPIEEVASDEEHVRRFLHRFRGHKRKRRRKILVRQPPLKPTPAEVDVCRMNNLHRLSLGKEPPRSSPNCARIPGGPRLDTTTQLTPPGCLAAKIGFRRPPRNPPRNGLRPGPVKCLDRAMEA